ncbi:MAG TPA: two-component regulator propeller domain-containing protein [Dongiaceae bacterium]|nr:two-component regulator propeller domain-containing protein [Dongiaceae bacterium]
MITIRRNKARALRAASQVLLLCIVYVVHAQPPQRRPAKSATAEASNMRFARAVTKAWGRGDLTGRADSSVREFANFDTEGGHAPIRDLKFTHLTTSDGLSQSNVTEILQDRRGFIWFATRDGLNRYDGNTFVVYKHNPNDPASLSANYIWDLTEDDHGYLWIATDSGGVNRFDPTTERFVRYRHDPNNANSISGDSVETIARDSRGHLWFGTEDNGLDKFDPSTGTFTHYPNDDDGQFVGRITKVISGRQGDIWFVGERGLFHLNPQTGQIARPPATIKDGLAADYVYEDDAGNLWMLAWSPIVGLVKYDPHAERLTKYPIGTGAVGVASWNLLADGQNGFWVPSSQGLHYFDRRTERFTFRFQHDESDPDGLNDDTVASVYRDRGGLLWVGTEDGGLNILNLRQEQFGFYHHANNPNSLSPGKVTAIYEEPGGILWIGFFPRRLDRLDRKTGRFTHFVPGPDDKNLLGRNGSDLIAIYKDARGYLWLGGWGGGLDRFDERTGEFKHYRYNPKDPNSLLSNGVYRIYGDRSGQIWVGQLYGLSRLDPVTEKFTNYRPDPRNRTWNGNSVWSIYQDRSGTLWFGTGSGALIRSGDGMKTRVNYMPDSRDPHKLNGGAIDAIHEDRAGTLWVGAWDGLYRFNRQNETFTRYTESQGLPSSNIQGILEDKTGKLWLSTKKGISRFDPETETFRNFDVSDGLQGDEFSESCDFEGPDGEMFFGGSFGLNAFFPESIRDNPYVPPIVITSLKIFNKPVPIGAKSALKKAIPYIDSLTLSYRDSVFSFEFAALSYANSQKNRYRYKLEGFEPGWNEVGSKQRLATYTNLDPGKYLFRVQGSNSDGVWNEEGVSLPILITPPWWRTNWFRAFCGAAFLALLWAAYQLRVRQLQHQFEMTLEARVGERTRIARELHDTLLQSFQALLPLLQAGINMFGSRPADALRTFEKAADDASQAIAEGRDAIQGLRTSTVEKNDLAVAIRAVGEELASAASNQASPNFNVVVEGLSRNLHPILRDEVYRLATEALRNAFRHAAAQNVEVEIRYDEKYFRLRVRDDGKGIPSDVLSGDGREGHYGLHSMRERASLMGGKLAVWSEVDVGTEVELRVPANTAYAKAPRSSWLSRKFAER